MPRAEKVKKKKIQIYDNFPSQHIKQKNQELHSQVTRCNCKVSI